MLAGPEAAVARPKRFAVRSRRSPHRSRTCGTPHPAHIKEPGQPRLDESNTQGVGQAAAKAQGGRRGLDAARHTEPPSSQSPSYAYGQERPHWTTSSHIGLSELLELGSLCSNSVGCGHSVMPTDGEGGEGGDGW